MKEKKSPLHINLDMNWFIGDEPKINEFIPRFGKGWFEVAIKFTHSIPKISWLGEATNIYKVDLLSKS